MENDRSPKPSLGFKNNSVLKIFQFDPFLDLKEI